MSDAEQQLQRALLTSESADDAIWRLHKEQQIGQVILSRAVATVFELTLTEARQAVADAVNRQGISPLEPRAAAALGWPDREASVLDQLERHSPLWQHQVVPSAAYRVCYLPSWEMPLLLAVDLTPVPALKAMATEPFSGPDPQGRVRVPRCPVPVDVETELHSWSAQAHLSEGMLSTLEKLAEPLTQPTQGESLGVGIDGITILVSIRREEHITRFRTWSPKAREEPHQHAFLSSLVNLALALFPQGQVHQAARDVAKYLSSRA